jgi:hypothetical protein
MRLAWFRPAVPDSANPLDDSGALLDALRASHDIDVVTAAAAHDFVWMHARRPYDLCLFELDDTPAHQFIWPYLLQYGGVTCLRRLMLNGARASALLQRRRSADYRAEVEFSRDWRLLRAPLVASRMVVVSHPAVADTLQAEYPDARVRYAPLGVPGVPRVPGVPGVPAVRVGVLAGDPDVAQNAFERAREADARVTLLSGEAREVLREADIVVAMRWPPFGEPETAALAGMAAGKPVIVMETETTADWPAYDPQTWRSRASGSGGSPVVVSIDPRDEEHSLMVAIRDLARDRELRASLGASAHEWWRAHATPERAAAAWQPILSEARAMTPPARPAGWPHHLSADGTDEARAILRDMGAAVDFL